MDTRSDVERTLATLPGTPQKGAVALRLVAVGGMLTLAIALVPKSPAIAPAGDGVVHIAAEPFAGAVALDAPRKSETPRLDEALAVVTPLRAHELDRRRRAR